MAKTENLSNGGLELFYRSWRPASTPRAIVVIVPGFNSHSGYYEWAAEQLIRNGLAVYAIDLRGRGQSEGERFYVDRFEDYVSDVHALVTVARSRNAGLPLFILGHSAGGVVACLYAIDHQSELAGLIGASFAFKVPAPDVALVLLKGLSHVAPHAHVLRLKNEDFSRDPTIVQQMNGDPLIADEKQPTQTVAQMVRADQRLEQEFSSFTLPLLILHGTDDRATKPSGSQQFYDSAASRDKTLKLYKGAYHDLFNDTDHERVMTDVSGWIESHVSMTGRNRSGAEGRGSDRV